MADVRTYTYTAGVGLVEDSATSGDQPAEETEERPLYQGGQMAAAGLGAAMTWNGGSVRIRVTTDADAGTLDVAVI